MKPESFRRSVVIAAIGAGLILPAHAQEPAPAATLEEVVVTGSREATPLSATPAAIGKMDNKALEDAKATNITQAVNQIPGVHMVDLGNEQHSMSIRQPITTNAVYQYLEDGVPIRPLGVFNHNALNEVNLTGAGEIEVLKGPASSLYGSNAVGGSVNFITQAPALKPEGKIGLQASSEGYKRLDTGASDTWGDFGLRFAHYSARLRDSWRQYNDMDKDSVTLRGDYAASDRAALRLLLTHNNLDTQTPGSLNESDYRNQPAISYQTFTYRRDETTRLSATLDREWSKDSLSTVTLFARDNEHGQNPAYSIRNCAVSATCPTGYVGNINTNSYTSLGLDARQRRDFSFLDSRLIAGLTYDRSPNNYVEDKINVTRDANNVYTGYATSTRNRDYDTLIRNSALYAQYELSPGAATRVVAGGRYDTIGYDFTNNLTPGSSTGAPSETRSFHHFSPKLGMTYKFTPATHMYANYSQGFIPPEVSSLYARLAVPDLRSSVFNNYELGVRSAFGDGKGKLDAAVYRLDGKDELVSYQIAVGNSEPRNAGKTRHAGVELGASYAPSARWDTRLAATVAHHEYVDYDVSSTLSYDGKVIKGAPRNIGFAEVAYKPVHGLRLGLEAQYVSEYWMNDANTVEYPGHTVFNLRTSYTSGAWETWLKLMNLRDEKYSTSAGSSYSGVGAYNADTMNTYTPGDPRTLWLGVAYRFGAEKQ